MTSLPPNPSALPVLARRLFDADVAVVEVDPREIDPEHVLLPPERDVVERAIDTRRWQYAAGRHCAREGMRQLGLPPAPITQDSDRAPCFPPGIVGTITHTQWWCAAAVALSATHRALGVDVEPDTVLKATLFNSVLVPDEIATLSRVDEPLRGLLGKLVFSAKECAYKAQYTVSRTFYGFHGMRVALPGLDGATALPDEGEFSAIFLRDAGPFVIGDALRGRYVRAHGYLMTGVELRHG